MKIFLSQLKRYLTLDHFLTEMKYFSEFFATKAMKMEVCNVIGRIVVNFHDGTGKYLGKRDIGQSDSFSDCSKMLAWVDVSGRDEIKTGHVEFVHKVCEERSAYWN